MGLLAVVRLPLRRPQIGIEIGALDEATAAALVGAGIASVLLFPAAALVLLGREPSYAGSVASGTSMGASAGGSSDARGSH